MWYTISICLITAAEDGQAMDCENCLYYEFDEEMQDYFCTSDMDEDDYARLMQGSQKHCPLWRNGDEYAVVRHQM